MTELLSQRYHQLNFPSEKNEAHQASFIQAHLKDLPTSIRLHPRKFQQLIPTNWKPIPWCKDGFYLESRPHFAHDPLWHVGHYYVQEASSMMIGSIVSEVKKSINRPLCVLDVSAAPGGKTTHIASVLDQDDCLISNEVIAARANILLENVTKWGYPNNWVTNLDPQQFQKVGGIFDIIVLDAPCSGSGLWRKDAQALEDWNTNLVKLCAERQKRIIADILPCLKPDGIIIYSTCSYSVEENEHITQWMMHEWNLEPYTLSSDVLTFAEGTSKGESNYCGYRMTPWRIDGEGFYFSILRNNKPQEITHAKESKTNIKSQKKTAAPNVLNDIVYGDNYFFEHNDQWHFIPQSLQGLMQYFLNKKLHFKKIGTTIGKVIREELVPAHDVALSVLYAKTFPTYELTPEQALDYLRKGDIQATNALKGWTMVTYQGANLGFIKVVGHRVNNYYPKEWRLLK